MVCGYFNHGYFNCPWVLQLCPWILQSWLLQWSVATSIIHGYFNCGYFNCPWLLQLSVATSIVATSIMATSIVRGYFNCGYFNHPCLLQSSMDTSIVAVYCYLNHPWLLQSLHKSIDHDCDCWDKGHHTILFNPQLIPKD